MKLNKNHKIILANGALWALFNGLTSAYLIAYALALGASNAIIGLLGAMPHIATILTQITGATLVQHFKRKHINVVLGLASRLWWIAIIAAPYIFTQPIIPIIIFFLLVNIGTTLTTPAWASLIADTVPEKHRGEFVGKRYTYIGIFGITATTIGGLWLQQFPKQSPTGFAIMFAFGTIIGIISVIILGKIKEPPYKDHEPHKLKEFFTLKGELKKYTLFGLIFNFGYMFASPFFAVYILKNLGVEYEYFGILVAISTLARVISAKTAGKIIDKYGYKKTAMIGVIGTGLIPLVYLIITQQTLWLLIPAQIIAGISWAITDIAVFNLLISIASPEKQAMQIAEYTFYTAIALATAPILGGIISDNIKIILTGIPLVFAISFILRTGSAILLSKIKEPKAKKEYTMKYIIVHTLHSIKGIEHSIQMLKKIGIGLGLKR
ncbi:hypothetical protein B6U93_03170 [Candidatus Woesearchaeota archaeon ex4484_78]|nr:MAG: hypothetical protein B6U93_03170 [Candidatus Woesearchaeota archaeon ex4484_78]